MAIERHQYLFSGHVQGVGFRFTTERFARRRPVAGFVRNLADGRVELTVEGEADELAGLLSDILNRFRDNVRDVERSGLPADGEPLTGFAIRS